MLTPEKIQQANSLTGMNVPVTGGPAGNPVSRAAEIRSMGQKNSSASAVAPVASQPTIGEQTGQNVGDQFRQAGEKIKSSVSEGAAKFASEPTDGSIGTEVKRAGDLAETGLGAAAGAAQGVFAPITGAIQTAMQRTGVKLNAADNSPAKKVIDALHEFSQAHPEAAKNFMDAITVATSEVGGEKGLGDLATTPITKEGATKALTDTAKDISGGVKAGATAVKDAITPTEAETQAISASKNTKALDSTTADWARPLKEPKASFNKTREVAKKGDGIPKFLAEQGLDPNMHIENGRYVTKDTGEALRDTAGAMSRDTLRPSLETADYSTPKTPLSEIESAAIKNASTFSNVTAKNLEAVKANIKAEIASLSSRYEDGVGLTNMHDEKITYAKNGGYSPIGDAATNNNAVANRALSQALSDTLDKKAPPEFGVKDFNAYLQKYYKAADYLDTLDTKLAPVTVGQQIARGVAKFGGAAIGGKFGGGVVSEFAGYQIGKALEHALENFKGPSRARFLSNLERTNPAAFTKVQEYLKKKNTGADGILRLPAAGPNTPIPLGAGNPKPTNVAPHAAKRRLPIPDPKTGRMMRTYTSESAD